MATWSALFFNRELTLFADPATWRLHGLWLLYTLCLSVLLAHIDADQVTPLPLHFTMSSCIVPHALIRV